MKNPKFRSISAIDRRSYRRSVGLVCFATIFFCPVAAAQTTDSIPAALEALRAERMDRESRGGRPNRAALMDFYLRWAARLASAIETDVHAAPHDRIEALREYAAFVGVMDDYDAVATAHLDAARIQDAEGMSSLWSRALAISAVIGSIRHQLGDWTVEDLLSLHDDALDRLDDSPADGVHRSDIAGTLTRFSVGYMSLISTETMEIHGGWVRSIIRPKADLRAELLQSIGRTISRSADIFDRDVATEERDRSRTSLHYYPDMPRIHAAMCFVWANDPASAVQEYGRIKLLPSKERSYSDAKAAEHVLTAALHSTQSTLEQIIDQILHTVPPSIDRALLQVRVAQLLPHESLFVPVLAESAYGMSGSIEQDENMEHEERRLIYYVRGGAAACLESFYVINGNQEQASEWARRASDAYRLASDLQTRP